MRKTVRLLVKCVVGMVAVVLLVTLFSPLSLTLHPRTPETNRPPQTKVNNPFPPQALLNISDTNREKNPKNEIREKSQNVVNETNLTVLAKKENRGNGEGKGRESKEKEIVQFPFPAITNPPPEGWVEVEKVSKKPIIRRKEEIGKEERLRRMKEYNKNATMNFKVLGQSPRDLQERAKSFPEASSMYMFMREQERRLDHIDSTCRMFQPSLADVVAGSRGPPAGLVSITHIIYDRINQITFCPVYKAASTSWTINLMQLAGRWTEKMSKQPIQKLIKLFYPKISGLSVATVTKDTTHFIVVRHPLERLVSCYRDKFQNASKAYYYHVYGEKMVRRYRLALANVSTTEAKRMQEEVRRAMRQGGPINLPDNPFASPLGPTFPEFAEHVADTKFDDEHWKSYSKLCAPCSLNYDFVLKFESLEEENELFLEYLNRTGEVGKRKANASPGKDTKKLTCDFYKQLTLSQIDKLIDKYKRDLLLYEYDAEEYRKCAKDYGSPTAGISGARDRGRKKYVLPPPRSPTSSVSGRAGAGGSR